MRIAIKTEQKKDEKHHRKTTQKQEKNIFEELKKGSEAVSHKMREKTNVFLRFNRRIEEKLPL